MILNDSFYRYRWSIWLNKITFSYINFKLWVLNYGKTPGICSEAINISFRSVFNLAIPWPTNGTQGKPKKALAWLGVAAHTWLHLTKSMTLKVFLPRFLCKNIYDINWYPPEILMIKESWNVIDWEIILVY